MSKSTSSFETHLEQLESIVTKMEDDELSLEELIENYEKGVKNLQSCENILGQAKKRLETITKSIEATTTPTADTTTADTTEESSTEDDDIRLL